MISYFLKIHEMYNFQLLAIQVCFQAALEVSKQELRDAGLCEYCPLAWYQRLCALVNGEHHYAAEILHDQFLGLKKIPFNLKSFLSKNRRYQNRFSN